MEDYLADYELQLKEALSCVEILQAALQNEKFPIEYEKIDNNLEVVRNILEKLVCETKIMYNELFTADD